MLQLTPSAPFLSQHLHWQLSTNSQPFYTVLAPSPSAVDGQISKDKPSTLSLCQNTDSRRNASSGILRPVAAVGYNAFPTDRVYWLSISNWFSRWVLTFYGLHGF